MLYCHRISTPKTMTSFINAPLDQYFLIGVPRHIFTHTYFCRTIEKYSQTFVHQPGVCVNFFWCAAIKTIQYFLSLSVPPPKKFENHCPRLIICKNFLVKDMGGESIVYLYCMSRNLFISIFYSKKKLFFFKFFLSWWCNSCH